MVAATEQPEGFSLLPSFYETITQFVKDDIPLVLCFRTFGTDLLDVRSQIVVVTHIGRERMERLLFWGPSTLCNLQG